MTIYKHRANSIQSIKQAAENGWGIEIDLRTHNREIYVEHDCVLIEGKHDEDRHLKFHQVTYFINKYKIPTLLDFKESGIVKQVFDEISVFDRSLYKTIDLIAPDVIYNPGIFHLARLSPFENIQIGSGYWVDFPRSIEDIKELVNDKKEDFNVLVSPELHRGNRLEDDFIKAVLDLKAFKGVCTDDPKKWEAMYASR